MQYNPLGSSSASWQSAQHSGISITNTALAIPSPFLFLLRLKLKNIIFLTAYHATIAVHFLALLFAICSTYSFKIELYRFSIFLHHAIPQGYIVCTHISFQPVWYFCSSFLKSSKSIVDLYRLHEPQDGIRFLISCTSISVYS